ncbi:hypothetical protein [Natrialba sp. SSL1]|uniref:hypothetical protein n=1 Tax=Natrialba sp. SSL1 TaxID=1869245 RepID=UPI0008F944C2|nr:hypothetical protein [Natrialba sp. SSL1]OIB55592.1 hypothetical protein BBD46_04635 [Natrialba sp. SSL1]
MSPIVDGLDWARVVERLLYLFPPIIGVGIVGVLQELEYPVPGLDFGLFLVGTFGYTVLTLALAMALVLDAKRVREQPKASGNWRPHPWLNGLFALLWAPVAGVVYLARRHRRFGTPAGWSGWWLVIAATLATTVGGLVAAIVAFLLAIPGVVAGAIGLAGAIAVGAFPVAIHQDAAYVCTESNSWRPNPGIYLGLAFLSLSVAPLQPLVAGYYLRKRRREIGLDGE